MGNDVKQEVLRKSSEETKRGRSKGPRTVVLDAPLEMVSDPIGEADLTKDLEKASIDKKDRIKKKEDILVERYNPEVENGLTNNDVEARMLAGMSNTLSRGSSKTYRQIFRSNIITFFNFIIFSIAGWLFSVREYQNTIFLLVVIINITVGIIQEIRAKKMLDSLSLLSAPTSMVIRDGQEYEIAVTDVVIDDILLLTGGKQITVDSVVRQGTIEVNESLLTGESDPVVKKAGDTLFSGSYVISGTCYAQATAIGKDIYVEKLADQAKVYKKPKSELLKSLTWIIRAVSAFIIPLGFALFYMMFLKEGATNTYPEAVSATAGAMIGMIPSGLFLITSMALAIGVLRLGQNNTLVQELYCIEMLARVDTLCLDKTGTITDGTMTVKNVIEYKKIPNLPFASLMSAYLNAHTDQNLTSKALVEKFGNERKLRVSNILAFSSQRKYSGVEFDRFGTILLGAPEFILNKNIDLVNEDLEKYTQEGYRVLAIASSTTSLEGFNENSPTELIGLILIEDTIRPDAFSTIQYFRENGVDVRVISGDNAATASKISERAGIENADQYISLEGMSDKDVVRVSNKYTVFGRVTPHQKRLLIEAFKNNGRTVAMTGDGVNDILALKEADTSIAMASGSEAARNVSHLVLLDSNFASMPKVVSEGRRVINNIQRVSTLFLTKTVFSFLLAIIALIREGLYPITPIQLSLIDYFVIAVPSFVLALEYNNKQVKGRFLVNILKAALPGAIVVMINSLIIYGLEGPLGLMKGSRETSTLIVLSATFTSFMVLLRVCQPLNSRRTILYVSMAALTLLLVIVSPNLFNFSPLFNNSLISTTPSLKLPHILLLLVLMLSSYRLIYIIDNLYGWVKTGIKKVLDLISNVE